MRALVASVLIGLVAGFVGGLAGVGGGVIMIPLMVSVLGVTQHQAHGTSLVSLVFTGLAGAITYSTRGAVDVWAAVALAIPAVSTARFGARYAHALPEWQLKRAFGVFLLGVVTVLLLKPYLIGFTDPLTGATKIAVLLVAGTATGFLSGMMGIGGGNVMVPAMVLVAGFPQVLAQGSSLLAMVPAGAAGAHKHWQLGNVVRRLVPGLVPGILLGTWAGSTVALRLDESILRFAFIAVAGYSGLKSVRAAPPVPAVATVPAPR